MAKEPSFKCKETQKLFLDENVKRFSSIQRQARRKLLMLANATKLEDLRIPPGNKLKALGGDRKGQYSIKINDQWRICFMWDEDSAYDVEIVDYH